MNSTATHNYTGYGWEGNKYLQTKELPKTEIAKLIKADIKKKYPNVKVSIRTEYFAGGSSINLTVIDFGFNPMTEQYILYRQSDISMAFGTWCDKNGYVEMKYTKEAEALLSSIKAIGNGYRYSDTDCQIDYFDTNFYYFVSCEM